MQKRLTFTFLLHLFGLSLLLIPNQFQGPVVFTIFDIPLRVLDAVAVILIVAASVYLYTSLFLCLRAQKRQARQLSVEQNAEENEK